ncbi:unnamed protein product [Cyprideis torosa]|uniref:Uncharacterized protein n=1 Tax=Cyprideis torosa TaxID=163714 RepID=A0A7R8W123_9CRUS|nr:unnamed protein product [Cyprideis torosa]CAG0880423.1 unnamed protein product [Cyprideis torosa]
MQMETSTDGSDLKASSRTEGEVSTNKRSPLDVQAYSMQMQQLLVSIATVSRDREGDMAVSRERETWFVLREQPGHAFKPYSGAVQEGGRGGSSPASAPPVEIRHQRMSRVGCSDTPTALADCRRASPPPKEITSPDEEPMFEGKGRRRLANKERHCPASEGETRQVASDSGRSPLCCDSLHWIPSHQMGRSQGGANQTSDPPRKSGKTGRRVSVNVTTKQILEMFLTPPLLEEGVGAPVFIRIPRNSAASPVHWLPGYPRSVGGGPGITLSWLPPSQSTRSWFLAECVYDEELMRN